MSMPRKNFILDTDSYKVSHWKQYPPGTTNISSYIESRGGDYKEVVFFGLQAWIKANLVGEDTRITYSQVQDARKVYDAHGEPFNEEGWMKIVNDYHGRPPIEIEAVDEGTVLPPHNVMVQLKNLDPTMPWLTSYVETSLLRGIWYPTTVATRSRYIKKIIKSFLDETADNSDGLLFKLHDFGARGVSSYESAMMGGMAHLVNFMGTDTVPALDGTKYLYDEPMAGFSIPAAEHSTITSWGSANEDKAFSNMLDQFGGPGKLVAVVSDSYDIMHAVNYIWGEQLKDKVKTNGATLVVRPDSGIPTKVVLDVVHSLGENFGFTVNSKGYKMLPPYLRVIQGDGINEKSIEAILQVLKDFGWSADNVAFGMGGELLQTVNRDTLKFAMKASAISFNNAETWQDVWKAPAGDLTKASRRGRLALIGSGYRDFDTKKIEGHYLQNILKVRYSGHSMYNTTTFKEVRERAAL